MTGDKRLASSRTEAAARAREKARLGTMTATEAAVANCEKALLETTNKRLREGFSQDVSTPQIPEGEVQANASSAPLATTLQKLDAKASRETARQAAIAEIASKRQDEISQFLQLCKTEFETWEWRKLKPYQVALLLHLRPYRGKGGETFHLTLQECLLHAFQCFERGISPFYQAWYNRDAGTSNANTEGKMQQAENKGYKFGPPSYEWLEQEWPKTLPNPGGFEKDIGCRCVMSIHGWDTSAEYTAWLSEWFMPASPVWRGKPRHMLQLRAKEKTVSMGGHVGESEMPGEGDIEESSSLTPITAVAGEFKPIK